ncbi:hypothetical protein [Lysobacter enzymogenes]|uniref:hypothetical protein n=1 Tax=Lysobacter enzymogenes TaxID=69 RepID=UPI001F6190D1|nr:hypothetical protein [Lysobacter enzymogenes]
MTPFQRLGLAPDSDERAIKRAYARELKRCRPDDDPEGFQALQEAYRECLHHAARLRIVGAGDIDVDNCTIALGEDGPAVFPAAPGDEGAEVDVPDQPDAASDSDIARPFSPPSSPASHAASDGRFAPLSAQRFDADAFMHELLQRARETSPEQLENWLQNLKPLYSLELKYALREPLAQTLAQIEPRLPPNVLRMVFAFFALDQVGARDAQLLEYTRRAQARADGAQEYERILAQYQPPQGTSLDLMLLRELHGPRSWWRRLTIALFPGQPGRAARLAMNLLRADRDRAAQQLDHESVELWQRAADPTRIALPRLIVVLLRMLLYPLPLLGPISLDRAKGSPDGLLTICLTLAALWLLGSTIRMLWLRWLIALQRGQVVPVWRDAPLQLFVGFAIASLALLPVSTGFAALTTVGAGWIWLIARGRERVPRTLAAHVAGLLLAMCVPQLFGAAFALPERPSPQTWLTGLQSDPSGRIGWVPPCLLFAAATPVLQDLWRAGRERIDLVYAREMAARPWALLAAAGLALAACIAIVTGTALA